MWAFCVTFQFYLNQKLVGDFDSFFDESKPFNEELIFKLLTARRSNLPNELMVYLFYMLDDPKQDAEPIFE